MISRPVQSLFLLNGVIFISQQDRSGGRRVRSVISTLAMEAVAEGIEHSACVLICISDLFKRDNHCQAEVQYAFQRKRPLIPVIVRKGGKPDGWLSSIVNKKACIDLATSDSKSALTLLAKAISQPEKYRSSQANSKSPTSPSKNRDEFVAIRAPVNAAPSSRVVYSIVSVSNSTKKKQPEPTPHNSESTPSRVNPTSRAATANRQEPTAPSAQRTTDRSKPQTISSKTDSPPIAVRRNRQPQETAVTPKPRTSKELAVATNQPLQSKATPLSSRSVTPTVDRATLHTFADRQESVSTVSATSYNSLESTLAIAQQNQERESVRSRLTAYSTSWVATEAPIVTNQQPQATATPLNSSFTAPRAARRSSDSSENSLASTMANVQSLQEEEPMQSQVAISTASRPATDTSIVTEQQQQPAARFSVSTPSTDAVPFAPAHGQTPVEARNSIFRSRTTSSVSSDSSLSVGEGSQALSVKLTTGNTSHGPTINQAATTSTISTAHREPGSGPSPPTMPRVVDQQHWQVEASRAATTNIAPERVVRQESTRPVESYSRPPTNDTWAPVAAVANQRNEQNLGRADFGSVVARNNVSGIQTSVRAEQTREPIPIANAAPPPAATAALLVQQERLDQSSLTSPYSMLNANQATERQEVVKRSEFRSSASGSNSSESFEENSSSPEESVYTDAPQRSVQTTLVTPMQTSERQNVNVSASSAVPRTIITYGSVPPLPPMNLGTVQQRSRPPVIVPRPPANSIIVQQRIEPPQQQQWQTPIYHQPDSRPPAVVLRAPANPIALGQRPPQAAPILDSTGRYTSTEQQQPQRVLQQAPRPVLFAPRLPANPVMISERSQQHVVEQPPTGGEASINTENNSRQISTPSTVRDSREELASIRSASSSKPSSISAFIEKQKQKASRELDSRLTLSPASSTQSLVSSDSSMLIQTEIPHVVPLPEEYTHRVVSNSLYRSLPVNAWSKVDILDYLFDLKLYAMMPLCELMSGQAFIRLFRMCQEKPTRLYSQLNEELRSRFNGLALPIGVYTEFLTEMNGLLGPAVAALPTLLSAHPAHSDRVAVMVSSIHHQPASADGQSPGFTAEFTHEATASPERKTYQ